MRSRKPALNLHRRREGLARSRERRVSRCGASTPRVGFRYPRQRSDSLVPLEELKKVRSLDGFLVSSRCLAGRRRPVAYLAHRLAHQVMNWPVCERTQRCSISGRGTHHSFEAASPRLRRHWHSSRSTLKPRHETDQRGWNLLLPLLRLNHQRQHASHLVNGGRGAQNSSSRCCRSACKEK